MLTSSPRGAEQSHAYLLPQTHSLLFCHTLGNAHGCHTPGLGATNLAPGGEAGLLEVLSHLGGLATASFTNHHKHLQHKCSTAQLVATGQQETHNTDIMLVAAPATSVLSVQPG